MEASDLTILSASPACIGGGAERVALMLHKRYVERGIDSWLAVANRNCDDPRTVAIPPDEGRGAVARAVNPRARALAGRGGSAARLASKALRAAAAPSRYARVLRGHEDLDFPSTSKLLRVIESSPDVLHLHNLHGAWFDVRALPTLSAQVPTVLTMHDTWLLTGHCAYPLECTRWKQGCGDCPHLDFYVPIRRDASRSNAAIKRDAVRASRLALACPSQWLLDMVDESGILSDSVIARVVPNGIDTEVFRPGDRVRARAAFDLPTDATILCFAARTLEESPYKGYQTLVSALSMLADDLGNGGRALLLALGSVRPTTHIGGLEIRSVPFVEDPAQVAMLYQASDIYVHPARAESFGLAVAEAMACGIPVVAANVGGIPEILGDAETGVLFAHDDPAQLAAIIRDLLGDEEKRYRLGRAGIERIRAHFGLERQVDAYLGLYAELVDERRG